MPMRPDRPCRCYGCGRTTSSTTGYCYEHRSMATYRHSYPHRRKPAKNRPTSTQSGYDANWRRARENWLNQFPCCMECARQHKATTATVVDHIIPHRGDRTLFWDRSNWQSLCKPCHDRKTATVDRLSRRTGTHDE